MARAQMNLNCMHTRINKTRSVAGQSFLCAPCKICRHGMPDALAVQVLMHKSLIKCGKMTFISWQYFGVVCACVFRLVCVRQTTTAATKNKIISMHLNIAIYLTNIVKSRHNYNKGMGMYFFFNPNVTARAQMNLNYMHIKINKTRPVADQSFTCATCKICRHGMP